MFWLYLGANLFGSMCAFFQPDPCCAAVYLASLSFPWSEPGNSAAACFMFKKEVFAALNTSMNNNIRTDVPDRSIYLSSYFYNEI